MSEDVKVASVSSGLSLSNLRHSRLALVLALAVILLLKNFLSGNFGELGEDSDDLIRFMQIRDYLGGQSWFDTDQYRMGLTAAGTDMHWSRLPDIPIILLTHFFDLFTTQDKALDYAISIWPPLSGLILFIAMLIGADHIEFDGNRKYIQVFTALLAGFFIATNFRFVSGAIDHHNLQFGFIALAMVWAMDGQMRASRCFLSGLATAICLAIGPEVYLFVTVICGYVALSWAIKGEAVSRAAQGFGIGLAFGVSASFFATVPPSNYGVMYCDALSLIMVTAALMGGLGLALVTKVSRFYGGAVSLHRRFIGLAVLGAVCLGALSFQAPQCLANPLDALPADVTKLWLGYVVEALPIYTLTPGWMAFVPMVMGPILLALCLLIYRYFKRFKQGGLNAQLWNSDALMTLLFLTAVALTIHQVRFAPFTYIFTLLIFARWIAQLYQKGLEKGGSNIKYIFAMAFSIPMIWAMPGSLLSEQESAAGSGENAANAVVETDCESDEVMAALNRAPKGLISAGSNMAGPILIHTQHNTLSGNYHRNWKGIAAGITISTSAPDAAYRLLKSNEINYIFYCQSPSVELYSKHNPDGLMAKLAAGDIPNFLRPISDPTLENGEAILFKVVKK